MNNLELHIKKSEGNMGRGGKNSFRNFFLPCHISKKRAHFLKNKFFMLYSGFFLMLILALNASQKLLPGVLGYASSIKVTELHQATNDYRVRNDLPKLILSPQLSKGAMEKAKYMFEKNFWAHTAPDGTEPWAFFTSVQYSYVYAGENLAKNFGDARGVVDAWIVSPTHRENLISANFSEVGYAVMDGILDGKETTIVVQFFGTPKDYSAISTTTEEQEYLNELKSAEVVSASTNSSSNNSSSTVVDIPSVYRYLAFGVLGFVLALFALDIYYSRKKDIDKFTGHTEVHILIFVATLVSLLVILRNGHIL